VVRVGGAQLASKVRRLLLLVVLVVVTAIQTTILTLFSGVLEVSTFREESSGEVVVFDSPTLKRVCIISSSSQILTY
jgi:hypothetical protein